MSMQVRHCRSSGSSISVMTGTMIEFGFTTGSSSACIFRHKELHMELVVHGDDFTVSGNCGDKKKFAEDFGTKYIVKIREVLGPDRNDLEEITLLNRVITWNDDSIDIEADPRLADSSSENLACDDGEGSMTPGCNMKGDKEPYMLDKVMTTKYSSITARLNCMASDRAHLRYSVKELCRDMSAPSDVSLQTLKRVGRYLEAKPRLKTSKTPEGRSATFTLSCWL